MAGELSCLALCLALVLHFCAGGAAAACVTWEQDSKSGCNQCSADGLRCEQCSEHWVMSTAGECIKCNGTIIGDRRTGGCLVCKPDNPTFCLKCAGHCNPYGCISSFVTRDGACSECPIWAAACEDVTGVPTKCRDGYGLVAGECRRCFNEKHNGTECRQCNGDLSTCHQCSTTRFRGPGFYSDPATGICQPCDRGCRTCNGPGDCLECENGRLDPATKTCRCSGVANCQDCDSAGTCSECLAGYTLAAGQCVPCQVPNCMACDDGPAFCSACRPYYGLVLNQCKRCVTADSGCIRCDNDPAVCMECSKFDPLEHSTVLYTSTYPDPATGICGPCKVPGCHRCVLEDATRCDGSMYMTRDGCMAGFYLNETDAQCYPCTAVGCSTCSPETPEKCSGIQCSSGYWWDETAEACKPCTNGCNVCDLFKGEQCEQCADGYYLEMGTRLCKPCSDPAGNQYATCAPFNRRNNTSSAAGA